MEIKVTSIVCAVLSALLAVQALALPLDSSSQGDSISADKRPKYMDTRDLTAFKELIYLSLQELVDEGRINPKVIIEQDDMKKPFDKRGSSLRLCVKKYGSQLYPYPCWKTAS